MSFRIRVTLQAARDLDAILDYLRNESPQVARDFGNRFSEITAAMTRFDISRSTRSKRYRVINMHPYPYLIFLRKRHDDIEIVAIRHGARDPSAMPARPR